MVVLPAPFSQVSGHLLPFQAGELNPLPVDQGLAPQVKISVALSAVVR
jgi:hypothetical protein